MKTEVYSTYEAKAQFSKILRKVMRNRRVIITRRGEPIAEIGPVTRNGEGIEDHLKRLESEGIITRNPDSPLSSIAPLEKRAGALDRFLEDRD
jgi:prevent-host-death family protein